MRVYSPSPTFAALAEITNYSRIQIIRRFIGRSVMQIDMPVTADIVGYMQKNCWIIADDDEPFIIRNIQQTEQTVTVYAYGGHFGFEGRITIPDTGMYAIEKTGSADAVVKEFINKSIPEGNRSLNITCLPAQAGTAITDQSRLKNLGDEVSRVLIGAGLGERFRIVGNAITFDTYAGTDRRASCVFDLKYKNVKDFTYTLDATKTQSTPIVGGAGEGPDREMKILGDDAVGWDRREVFVDARDVNAGDTDTLTQRALQALIGDDQQVKADVAASANLVYGVDYFLGDTVTVNVLVKTYQKTGSYYNSVTVTVPLVVQITDATETIDNGVRTIDLTFGSVVQQSDAVQTRSSIAQLQTTEPDSAMAAADMLTELKTVDGAGSGLDADLLDGNQAAAFLLAAAYTAADVLSKIKGVDGTGSGLDADLLDGKEATTFLLATAYTAADILSKLTGVDGTGSGLDADLLDGNHASAFMLGAASSATDNIVSFGSTTGKQAKDSGLTTKGLKREFLTLTKSTNQAPGTTAETIVSFDGSTTALGTTFLAKSGNQIKANVACYVKLTAHAMGTGLSYPGWVRLSIRKNGSTEIARTLEHRGGNDSTTSWGDSVVAPLIQLAANDYIELTADTDQSGYTIYGSATANTATYLEAEAWAS